MRDGWFGAVLVVCGVGCVGAAEAQAQSVASPTSGAGYETVTLTLPKGDADAGRQAFVDLRCTACHEVTGDGALPAPVSDSPGPALGPSLGQRPPGSLATAIVSPSHAMSIDTSPETRANVEGVLSPMGDYSDTMTVRQLIDLIMFLETRP